MSNEIEAFKDIFGINNINLDTNIDTNDILILDNNFIINNDVNVNTMVNTHTFTNNNNIINKELIINNNLYCNNIINSTNITLNNNITVSNILDTSDIIVNNNIHIKHNLNVNNKCNQNDISTRYLNANTISSLTNITCNNSIQSIDIYNITATSNNLTCNNLFVDNSTFNTNFNINGNLYILNNITCNTKLNTANINIINDTTLVSSLNVNNNFISDNIICNNDTNINGSMTISSNSILNNLIINGILNTELLEFSNNESAKNYGLNINTFYKTGDVIKIVIPDELFIISLIGSHEIILYINDEVIDPGININSNYTLNKIGKVNNKFPNNYIIYYNALDINNNIIQSVSRLFKIYNYPKIIDIVHDSNEDIIAITTSGEYFKLTYKITEGMNIIISETIGKTIISLVDIIMNINKIEYIITVYLKRNNDNILTSKEYIFYK